MFRGNRKLGNAGQLNLKMEALGGEVNAVTSFDLTEFWLDYHLDYLQTGIHHFCDFLQHPLFEQVAVERSIILEEIKADYNDDNQLIDLDTLVAMELWPDHAMGLPITGNNESIAAITQGDLENWYRRYYQPGNMIMAIIGDFEPERVMDEIAAQFPAGKITSRHQYPVISDDRTVREQIRLVFDKDNQYRIQWAFMQFPLTPDLRICYQLIRRVLDDGSSSRLQRYIREEKGLVYDVSADMLYFNSGVTLSIECLVSKDRLLSLMDTLVDLVGKLMTEGITEEELTLAKRRYAMSLDCNTDTAHGVLLETLSPLVYPEVLPLEKLQQRLKTVGLEEVNRTLKSLLEQKNNCFALVGPWREKEKLYITDLLKPWRLPN